MRTLTFSPEVVDALRHERYQHPHPRVQQKLEVVWLKSQGLTHQDIARLAAVSRRTVQRYLDEFAAGGLDRLRRIPWTGTASELARHRTTLEDHFREQPPHSTAQAQAAIERLTGVRRSLTQVRAFLKKRSACVGVRLA